MNIFNHYGGESLTNLIATLDRLKRPVSTPHLTTHGRGGTPVRRTPTDSRPATERRITMTHFPVGVIVAKDESSIEAPSARKTDGALPRTQRGREAHVCYTVEQACGADLLADARHWYYSQEQHAPPRPSRTGRRRSRPNRSGPLSR